MTALNENETLLLQETLNYVGPFLEEHKEFYPFGMVIDCNHEIYGVAASINEEYPNSQDLITLLEDGFFKELNNGNYLLCAICFDIYIKETINGIEHKNDAIKVRFMTKNNSNEVVLPYIYNTEGTVVFK